MKRLLLSLREFYFSLSLWKYGVLMLFMLFLEIKAEFSKLSAEDKTTIIQYYVDLHQENIQEEKTGYEAIQQLKELANYIDSQQLNSVIVNEQILAIKQFVEENRGVGYALGKAEIRRIQWFEWDFYHISMAFCFLILPCYLASDAKKFYLRYDSEEYIDEDCVTKFYKCDVDHALMNGFSRLLCATAIPWFLYAFISQIMLRSERLFKGGILLVMLVTYAMLLLKVIWDEIRKEKSTQEVVEILYARFISKFRNQ